MTGRDDDLWVFAYGSLMWRTGFDCVEAHTARLDGFHREFCIYSHHHRGTPERPGLVLGLDRGGACQGIALRVAAENREAVIAYLDERELITGAYTPRTLEIALDGGGTVAAYTFVANRGHAQYAGRLEVAEAARLIMGAEGRSGLNRDYLINTVRHLEGLGFGEARLHALLAEVERQTGEIERGGGI